MKSKKVNCLTQNTNINYSSTTNYKNYWGLIFVAVALATIADVIALAFLVERIVQFKYIIFPILIVLADIAFLAIAKFVNFHFRYSILVWAIYVACTILFTALTIVIPTVNDSARVLSNAGIVIIAVTQIVKVLSVATIGLFYRNFEGAGKKNTKRNASYAIVAFVCVIMAGYCFSNIRFGFMAQGNPTLSNVCTNTYEYNQQDGTYTVSGMLSDGDTMIVPETFNGRKVAALDCKIFGDIKLTCIEIVGEETTIINCDKIYVLRYDLVVKVKKQALDTIRSAVFDAMIASEDASEECSELLRAIEPSDLEENQICYNFNYADINVAKKLGLPYLPSVVLNEGETLSFANIAIDAKYIGHNDINSFVDLAQCYKNSNGYMLLPLTEPELSDKGACQIDLQFERVYKIMLEEDNDKVYKYAKDWVCAEKFDGTYAPESKLGELFYKLPRRQGLNASWSISSSTDGERYLGGKDDFIDYCHNADSSEMRVTPFWSVNIPETNNVFAQVVGGGDGKDLSYPFACKMTYGESLSLKANYKNTNKEKFSLAKTYYLYKEKKLLATSLTGEFVLDGYKPADSAKYTIKVVASDPAVTSLTSASKDLNLNLSVGKKDLQMNWATKTFEYNGKGHELVCAPEASNIVAGDQITFHKTLEFITDAGGYNSRVVLDGECDTLYAITAASETILAVVTPKKIDAVWSGLTCVYNGAYQIPQAVAFDVNGHSNILTVTGSQTVAGKDYAATASTFSSNYELNNPQTKFVINRKPIQIQQWDTIDFTYNGRAQYRRVVTLSNCVAGEENATINSIVYTGFEKNIDKGEGYSVVAALPTVTNYELTGAANTSYNILAKHIDTIWDTTPLIYNGQLQKPIASAILVTGEKATLATDGGQIASGTNYPSTATYNNANYILYNNNTKFAIAPKKITISLDNKGVTYGDNDMPLTYNIPSGALAMGDTADMMNINVTRATGREAGGYSISASYRNTNYDVTFATGVYTIAPKAMTITFDNQNVVYGGSEVPLTYKISVDAFEYGETENVLGLSITRENGRDVKVGGYAIGATYNNRNYTVTFVKGVYTITPKSITVTLDNKSATYGADVALTATIPAGALAYSDNQQALYLSITRESGRHVKVGGYAIGATYNNRNYTVTFVGGVYTIMPKPITVTLDNKSATYGEDVALTATIPTGALAYSDNQQALKLTIIRESGNDVRAGGYAIAATCDTANYIVTFNNAIYTIKPKQITVTLDNKSAVYGAADVALTATIQTGVLAYSDNQQALKLTITRESGKDVKAGGYAISATYNNTNYNVKFVNGVYTITPKSITVTLDNKSAVYGAADVALTATIPAGALAYSDSQQSLSLSITRESGKDVKVGGYAISAIYSNINYNVDFVNGVYTITPKSVTIEWSNLSLVFNGAAQKPTAIPHGIEKGDILEITVSGEMIEIGSGYIATATTSNKNYSLENATVQFDIVAQI